MANKRAGKLSSIVTQKNAPLPLQEGALLLPFAILAESVINYEIIKGASIKDVPSKSGLFDPLPPLSPL